jgi:hypothetical protein
MSVLELDVDLSRGQPGGPPDPAGHPAPGPSDAPEQGWQEYLPKVREYLAYCEQSGVQLEARGATLDPKYHPTADGAVKMIAHGGNPAEAKKIRKAFRALTGGPADHDDDEG